MGFLVFVILIGTTVWVGYDSSTFTSRGAGKVGGTSTAGWVCVCLLFWILGFPAYLIQRSKMSPHATPTMRPPGAWNSAPGYGPSTSSTLRQPPDLGYWATPLSVPEPGLSPGPLPRDAAAPIPRQLSTTEELERLGRLRDGGHLTDEEFAGLKHKILNS